MFASSFSSDRLQRLGRSCSAAGIAVCLGLAGCTSLDYSDFDLSGVEGIRAAPGSEWAAKSRRSGGSTEFFGASNKAREIEKHCGI
jgi:hypothetical protein